MYTDFLGKIAIVTGASRGIGRAVAKGLARAGAQVLCVSRKLEAVQEIADAIKRDGGAAVAMQCHTGHLEEMETLMADVKDKFGRLDILINNAATNPYFGPAENLPPSAFDKTVEVNLKGPYYLMSRAVALMKNSGGSIVNVASISALKPGSGEAVYAMTKAGLVNLTISFAKEYGKHGVRVNAVLPGLVETKMSQVFVDNPDMQKRLSELPVPRVGQPEDMVAGILYLASDQAAYTTGASLVMDGGATIYN